jgi:hypothetical protein
VKEDVPSVDEQPKPKRKKRPPLRLPASFHASADAVSDKPAVKEISDKPTVEAPAKPLVLSPGLEWC